MNPNTPLALYLPALKGAPLACLVALFLFEGPLTLEFLYRATGYDYLAINQAMKLLQRANLVTGSPRTAWRLAPEFDATPPLSRVSIYYPN
jgi:hypothetical protein